MLPRLIDNMLGLTYSGRRTWEVIATDEFEEWWYLLSDNQQDDLRGRIALLEGGESLMVKKKTYRNFSELAAPIDNDPQRRAAVEASKQKALSEIIEYNLAELRKLRDTTQDELAQALEIGQPRISRIEQGAPLNLETIRSYIEGLGGKLRLTATFNDMEIPIHV